MKASFLKRNVRNRYSIYSHWLCKEV